MIHEILHLIAGAVIGGLIGYCTNYLAIRMLFRPREEKRIGNLKVPFTPGVIPRRKDKLAREIGEAVAQKVFTDEDISGIFTSEGMKQTVADGMLFFASGDEKKQSIASLMETYLEKGEQADFLRHLDASMREKVLGALERNDMSKRIAYECRIQIRERIKGTVAARAISEDKIETLSDYLGRYLQHYVKVHVDDLIMPILQEETMMLLRQPTDQLLAESGFSEEMIKRTMGKVYDDFMKEHGADVVRQFDIAGLTEKKIIAFQPEEIEALVNRTIKREMQAVVNLGGVLGVIIGFVAALL
jgi:uncharacterized membrane protein YheB (UPF0754 family)